MDLFTLIANGLSRLPLERWLIGRRDRAKSLEQFADTLPPSEGVRPGVEPKETAQTVPQVETSPQAESAELAKEQAGTACIPCSINHLSTCSGLLSEAMRFARKDGIASHEVITRIGLCQDELNAMEREDLRPEKTAGLEGQDKQLADRLLTGGRDLRHDLENLTDVDALETTAAHAQQLRTEVGQSWLQRRLSRMSQPEKQAVVEKTLEKLET